MKWRIFLLLPLFLLAPPAAQACGTEPVAVPILLYHRFGPVVADSMTVRTSTFASQLDALQAQGHTVIPLRTLLACIAGEISTLPSRAVVITADDGHESIYTDLFPLILRYRIPVTLFIYPSAISNAGYAMTWQQLQTMKDSGLVDIQSHTYWHPNFRKEKQRLTGDEYAKFIEMQLSKSRAVLEHRLGGPVDLLAWPFGIYDDELVQAARQAGYIAGFTLERRPAGQDMMTLPRYLMTDQVQLARLLATASHNVHQP